MKQKKKKPKELCKVEMNTSNQGNIAYQTFRKGHGFQITVVKGEEYLIPFHKTGYWLLLHLEKQNKTTNHFSTPKRWLGAVLPQGASFQPENSCSLKS